MERHGDLNPVAGLSLLQWLSGMASSLVLLTMPLP
ncbi:Conserved hypothetical protein [Prochlorococcus marinus str. MIT 9313]|uniref:Uncharacterized protein n=1 Tax=Prochlorococcus marinus (strain MIT 9313) TaxID=74547 RepID=B9ERS3_PROMM|nr:Conserved hypothetical protein [Prochlorococcus marinus str. MIT 9313]